jgi:hypothetical protein
MFRQNYNFVLQLKIGQIIFGMNHFISKQDYGPDPLLNTVIRRRTFLIYCSHRRGEATPSFHPGRVELESKGTASLCLDSPTDVIWWLLR